MEKGFEKLKGMSEKDKSDYKNGLIKDAEEKMCSFLNICGGAESVVRIGIPYTTINEIATEKEADLIVMGARGLSYTKGVILGSVSESIIKSSPCPVMIVR
ncbi:MAG: universal stress protein, partial [Nitrospirae bacterium]|nr:universal stress protein [Nitrospirota bacterium]MDA8339614.1 universal stress protein [Nitrospiraceae bacterium]